MSRKSVAGSRRRIPLPIVALLVLLAGAAGYRLMADRAPGSHHPVPRAEALADRVADPARYAEHADIARVYQMAREIPQIVDGIYCYCHCERHFGHYSLLSCFEDDHGAYCDVCLQQVILAYHLHLEGHSLEEIRARTDVAFERFRS